MTPTSARTPLPTVYPLEPGQGQGRRGRIASRNCGSRAALSQRAPLSCHAHALGVGGTINHSRALWDFWQSQGLLAIYLHWNLEPGPIQWQR